MRRSILALTAAAACILLPATPASAVEIGSRCTAEFGDDGTRGQKNEVAGGATYTAPQAGILTKWGTVLPAATTSSLRLKIAAATLPAEWTVLRHSDFATAVAGVNTFDTRLPIAAGERIAVYSATFAGYCTTGAMPGEGSSREKFGPDTAVGSTFNLNSTTSGTRTALFAVIEADADNDGYGDESQDGCPQSAAFTTSCPVLEIKQKLSRARSAIKIRATASVDTQLTATARIKLSKRKTVKLKGKATSFKAATAQTIKLKLPASVRRALTRGKKLRATVTLTGQGLANTASSTAKITLKS